MYQAQFYRGDYLERQQSANRDGCVAYVEHHFNSSASASASYTLVITGANASQTSRNWGRWYAQAIAREFGVAVGGDQGIAVGGFDGRGDFNLRFTNMPAILLEPLFANNSQHADWIRSDDGQARLARVLVDSIQRFFPAGGTIGLSVGHKYKTSAPNDRGAALAGGGTEADYAEKVLIRAKAMLEEISAPEEEREIRVVAGDHVLWRQRIDTDANVSWDAVRGVLRIDQEAALAAPGARRARHATSGEKLARKVAKQRKR